MIRWRVDDFPWTKETERDKHSLSAFDAFMDVLESNRIFPLLGVIPGNCGDAELSYLKSGRRDVELGMHGIFHDESRADEFMPWMTTADITRSLRMTRTLFEHAVGSSVLCYMPPHNVIDRRTLDALVPAGFTSFTGGPETVLEYRHSRTGLTYRSSQPPHEYGRSDEMLERGSDKHLVQLESVDGVGEIWVTLHWTWETNIGLDHLDHFLGAIYR